MLRERIAARDMALVHLEGQQEALDQDHSDPESRIKSYVGRALAAKRGIDRWFWLLATADIIRDQDAAEHRPLLRLAARRIHATSAAPHRERLAATRFMFAKVLPID